MLLNYTELQGQTQNVSCGEMSLVFSFNSLNYRVNHCVKWGDVNRLLPTAVKL